MILNSIDFSDEAFLEEFKEASGSQELADAFIKLGGIPNFAQQMTVFGQAYSGLDVIEQITSAQAQESENPLGFTPPTEDIQILSVRISSYAQEDKELNQLEKLLG